MSAHKNDFLKLVLIVISTFFITTSAANASGTDEIGHKAGQAIPHDLATNDQNGKDVSFSNLTGPRGLILIFVRSASWCPYCETQMIEWNKEAARFHSLGYNIAFLTYEHAEITSKFAIQHGVSLPILSDVGSHIIRAFGLLNTNMKEGTRFYGIPHPYIYVIDPNKIIAARFAESSYKERPDIDVVHEALIEMHK